MTGEPELLAPRHRAMRVVKRSIRVAGHPTSVSLEAIFWERLKVLAAARGLSLAALVAALDRERSGPLSSALRVYVLQEALSDRVPR